MTLEAHFGSFQNLYIIMENAQKHSGKDELHIHTYIYIYVYIHIDGTGV
jgi:hypothetical protein